MAPKKPSTGSTGKSGSPPTPPTSTEPGGPRYDDRPEARGPRFDDRPEASGQESDRDPDSQDTPKKKGTAPRLAPGLPDYGDSEPGDPRRIDIEGI